MRPFSILSILVFVILPGLTPRGASAQECEPEKAEFAKLSHTVIIRSKEDARNYPRVRESGTERLHKYLEEQILQQLRSDSFPHPTNIQLRIRCVQSGVPEYSRFADVTNLPIVFRLPDSKAAVAVGFVLYRGGAGAPDLRPYFEVFQKDGQDWGAVGEVGASFAQRTFYVRPINAAKTGDNWFLLWGHRIGDSGARLRLAIAAYDGTSIREIWSLDGLTGTRVAGVFGDHIVLEGEVTNQRGRAEEFRERFDIVADGLKLVQREVTKSY